MKGSNPRIVLLGNNSGRNLGDAAILSSILETLRERIPDSEIIVPTISPRWIRKNYGSRYKVRAVNVLPWTGSLRLLGIPTLYWLAKSDAALICDGIIFGKKLFNPAFNYLITLIFLVPWAKLWGCKVICYSCGIGPFPTKLSRIFARWVIEKSDLVMLRERDSIALAREIGVARPIELTGDAAFINPVTEQKKVQEIALSKDIDLEQPILGVNITRYFDSWLPKEERLNSRHDFLNLYATAINAAKRETPDIRQVLVFSTQPMDEAVSTALACQTGAKLITNSEYLSHDIQGLMQRCSLLIGMRFHSLVLAAAVGTPVIGLIYAPKVRGFMTLLGCPNYGLELSKLTQSKLTAALMEAWGERQDLKTKQQRVVAELKQGASLAADMLIHSCFDLQQEEKS